MRKEEILRVGDQNVRIRLNVPDDAAKLLIYLRQVSEETHYMIRYADEVRSDEEEERKFLENMEASGRDFMLSAYELDAERRKDCGDSDGEDFCRGRAFGIFRKRCGREPEKKDTGK